VYSFIINNFNIYGRGVVQQIRWSK